MKYLDKIKKLGYSTPIEYRNALAVRKGFKDFAHEKRVWRLLKSQKDNIFMGVKEELYSLSEQLDSESYPNLMKLKDLLDGAST